MTAPDPKKEQPIAAGNSNPAAHALDAYSVQPKQDNASGNSPFYHSPAPTIAMPKGGGALKGIDEKFTVNAVNGTSSLQIPLPLTPGRGNFTPGLALQYNSGSGNSEFGLGWGLGLPAIQRKTDRRLPMYNDREESDVFLLAGAEDLVPQMRGSSLDIWYSGSYTIKRYKPRIEGLFARIEKITVSGSTAAWWKVTTRDNVVTYYGLTAAARVADPTDPNRIFKWLPEIVFDNKGNVQQYFYATDSAASMAPVLLHEQNRRNGLAPFTNTYLKSVSYCNINPFTPSADYAPALPTAADYKLTCVLDYGDHNVTTPRIDDAIPIPVRTDPFSDFHAGFEIRTYRKCKRVLMFHSFAEILADVPSASRPPACLVRSLDLTYRNDGSTALTEADQITSVTQTGYVIKADATYSRQSLPAAQFQYTGLHWDATVKAVSRDDAQNAPQGLSGNYQWIDLWGEGMPGILAEESQGWYYKRNLGDGHFTAAVQIAPKPSFAGLGSQVQWADLDADGRRQLVSRGTVSGFFELDDDQHWQSFRSFPQRPNIDWESSDTRLLDLNGDGRPDILITETNVWRWMENEGTDGYADGGYANNAHDEERGPRLLQNDTVQTIFLADMNGDGLTDIVRIKNGEICYWPNMGYGKFGAKVTMSNAPLFDHNDTFNPKYLTLADISGTGAPDLIYVGRGTCTAWINLAGNGWGGAVEISTLPETEPYSKIAILDFLGSGTACMVWSSPLPKYAGSPMRYIDLMGGKKPYLMESYSNGMGKKVELTYRNSTKYYTDDNRAGRPWITRLPFPVQCLQKVTTTDTVNNTSYSQQFTYHHGYYDHEEREFRGFGRVEATDIEMAFADDDALSSGTTSASDLDQCPVKTITWYHTGAWMQHQQLEDAYSANEYFRAAGIPELLNAVVIDTGTISSLNSIEQREAYRSLKGQALRTEVYALDGSSLEGIPYSVVSHSYYAKLIQQKLGNRFASFMSLTEQTLTVHCERNISNPRVSHEFILHTDSIGNPTLAASLCYPRASVSGLPSDVASVQQQLLCTVTTNAYTNDVTTGTDYQLRHLYETHTYEVTGLDTPGALPIYPAINLFNDLATAATATINYTATPNLSLKQRKLIGHSRILYLDNDASSVLAFGNIASLGLVFQEYRLMVTDDMSTASRWYNSRLTPSSVDSFLNDSSGFLRDGDLWMYFGSSFLQRFWIPSGTVTYDTAHFYVPTMYTDPWDLRTEIEYWHGSGTNYYLLPEVVTNSPLGIENTVLGYNWYNLQPTQVMDPNDNITDMLYDALGMPVAMALKGKTTETLGDSISGIDQGSTADNTAQLDFWEHGTDGAARALLQGATWRCIYRYNQAPVTVAMIAREIHLGDAGGSTPPVQVRLTYTDGLGRLAMHKAKAAPSEDAPSVARWVASGKTVYNNKGKAVMQYEPYFSVNHQYDSSEAAIAVGVTPRIFYDPMGRVYRTDLPDGTYTKTEWTAWKQTLYDNNDTVLDSDWYAQRTGSGALASVTEEADAAAKAALHADTYTLMHLDVLGRPFYTEQHTTYLDTSLSWVAAIFTTIATLDIKGNQLAVKDATGKVTLNCTYDLFGNPVRQESVDGGVTVALVNPGGMPLFWWDALGNRFRQEYELLMRPVRKMVTDTAGNDVVLEYKLYGETSGGTDKTQNMRGQIRKICDGAGILEITGYNFKGIPIQHQRTFTADPTITPDWTDTNRASSFYIESNIYTSAHAVHDALNRIIATSAYRGTATTGSPTYSYGGTIYSYDTGGGLYNIFIQSAAAVDTDVINEIYYNARGQRIKVKLENGATTTYEYDPYTFRVTRIKTTRPASGGGTDILQDLNYWYDPVGNITLQRDDAQQTIYFNGTVVPPENNYTYDPLYRLVTAEGREHAGGTSKPNAADAQRMGFAIPASSTDTGAMRRYKQVYLYDAVGNITKMRHIVGGIDSWTRNFTYTTGTNRLATNSIGSAGTGGETYTYDARGNIVRGFNHLMTTGDQMVYNVENRLTSVKKTATLTTYYQYGHDGQRARKVTVNSAAHTAKSRKYLDHWEEYLEYNTTTGTGTLLRGTLHVNDGSGRAYMLDTSFAPVTNAFISQIERYQFSDHLGTASLELDENANVISYEEYYPYGNTSFQSINSSISQKRYRYTGKERDEETGFYYMGARYYVPWIARWIAVDPLNSKYAPESGYCYGHNNPVTFTDPTGMGPEKHEPPVPKNSGTEEGERQVTSTTDSEHVHNLVVTHTESWYWHTGNDNHSKGWYPEKSFYEDILKPIAVDYNNFMEGKSDGQQYMHYILDVSRLTSNVDKVTQAVAKDLKENPTYESWARYIPIWGSAKQAQLDFSVGKNGWGIFNSVLAISDVFLLKSVVGGLSKGGITALGKDYMTWRGWRAFYGRQGFAEAGQQLHHWFLPREGASSGSGFQWWGKNQMWNLMPMRASKLLGLTGNEIHTLVHGNTIGRTGLSWAGNPIGFGMRMTYGTPTWFKTAINYGLGIGVNKLRD